MFHAGIEISFAMLFLVGLCICIGSGFEKIGFAQLTGEKTSDFYWPIIRFLSLAMFQISYQFLIRGVFFTRARPNEPDTIIGVILGV